MEESQFIELAISNKLNTQNKLIYEDVVTIEKVLILANSSSSGKILATVARHDAAVAIALLEKLSSNLSGPVATWNTGVNFGSSLPSDTNVLSAIAEWAMQGQNDSLKKSVVTGSATVMKGWNPVVASELESKFGKN